MIKKLRFEVFKRDGFVCQYCGQIPPEAILEIDHIIPKADNGTDDINNLITSCFKCNRGKGSISLDKIPPSLMDNLGVIKEQKKQMTLYRKYLDQRADQEEDDLREIGVHFFNHFAKSKRTKDKYTFGNEWKISMRRFLKYFNKYQVIEAIDIAVQSLTRKNKKESVATFKYTCGILHNWRKDGKPTA